MVNIAFAHSFGLLYANINNGRNRPLFSCNFMT